MLRAMSKTICWRRPGSVETNRTSSMVGAVSPSGSPPSVLKKYEIGVPRRSAIEKSLDAQTLASPVS